MTLLKVPDDKTIYINDNKNTALKIHYLNNFSDIQLFRGEEGSVLSLEIEIWLKMRPEKTISFSNFNTPYVANFKLELIIFPDHSGYKKMSICHDKIEVTIQNNTDEITFHVFPK